MLFLFIFNNEIIHRFWDSVVKRVGLFLLWQTVVHMSAVFPRGYSCRNPRYWSTVCHNRVKSRTCTILHWQSPCLQRRIFFIFFMRDFTSVSAYTRHFFSIFFYLSSEIISISPQSCETILLRPTLQSDNMTIFFVWMSLWEWRSKK
jgi:hypothetical protein